MYPFYESSQVELTPDDQAGICGLYPSCEVDGCDPGLLCTAGVCLPECGNGVCQLGELCIDGACISQEECFQIGCASGQPDWVVGCAAHDNCPDGLCLGDGSCAQQCSSDRDCRDGRPCVFDEDPAIPGFCGLIPRKKLGESCVSPLDCEDGECLAGAEARSVCTRRCTGSDPACPSGWSCSTVEGRPVCVSVRAPRGCGVSPYAGESSPEMGLGWMLLTSVPLIVFPTLRRRRRVTTLARSRSL